MECVRNDPDRCGGPGTHSGASSLTGHWEWVLNDVTCRTWWLRQVARSLVQLTRWVPV